MFPNLILFHQERVFLVPGFPTGLRGLVLLMDGLTGKDWGKEDFAYLSLFCVLCHQLPYPFLKDVPKWYPSCKLIFKKTCQVTPGISLKHLYCLYSCWAAVQHSMWIIPFAVNTHVPKVKHVFKSFGKWAFNFHQCEMLQTQSAAI